MTEDGEVTGWTMRGEDGNIVLGVVPTLDGMLHVNGDRLAFSMGYQEPPSIPNFYEAAYCVHLSRESITALRDHLTAFLEGKWAGLGVNSLPPFPGGTH